MKHLHHKIPKHMGGSNEPSNLIELTVAEHAEAHRILFEQHSKWQDEIAWKSLSGRITCEEAIRETIRLSNIGNRNAAKPHGGNAAHWKGKQLPMTTKQDISNTLKSMGIKPPVFTGHNDAGKKAIGAANIGMKHITNDTINIRLAPGQPLPDGFRYGLMKRAALWPVK